MRKPQVHVRRPLGLLALGALAILIAACSGAAGVLSTVGSSVGDSGGADSGRVAAPAAAPAFGAEDQNVSQSATKDQPLYSVGQPNLDIIKTGTLQLQVTDVDASLATATQKITALGGYASGSQRSGDGDQAVATVIYRIPAASWDEALVALRAIGTKVLGEDSQTEDVTTQIVDLGARITNLQVTEQALQSIMAQATKISDVLAVQQQLTDVRGQIEQATAERKHLQQQAAFSTLTVTYSLKEQAVLATSKKFDPNSEVDRASASLVDVLQGLATAGIWFAIVWLPILIGVVIVALIAAVVIRRVRRVAGGGGTAGDGTLVTTPAGDA